MRKVLLTISAAGLAACCAIGIAACKTQVKSVATPTQLELKSSGRLTWKAVDGATGYEVSVNGIDYTSVEEEEFDVFSLIKDESVSKLYVRAKDEAGTSQAAELDVTVEQLAAPEKPEVVEDEETHAKQFNWAEVENANRYGVKVNDSENWVSVKNNYWTLTEDGTYSIAVKCLAYVDGTEIYLESAASETSDSVEYIAGPLLYCDTLNEIYWQLEDGSSFSQYDLWIDGKEAAADIGFHGNENPLNLVEEEYLTRTGEYNIQIKAVKEDGAYAWSNMLGNLGTGNINPNEFYSFDNRIYSTPVAKEGVGISNEKYYGESGYSLKIEPGAGGGQINLVKYEGSMYDVDLRHVRSLSYWIYLEPVPGVTDTEISTVDVFKVAYDDELGNYQNRIYASGKSDYGDGKTIPVNQWTKVTIVNCVNDYDNVIILSWAVEMGYNYTIYLDQILIEEIEEVPEETEFLAQYSPWAGWYSGSAQKVAEGLTPGTSAMLKMQLQTSADGEADENVAIAAMNSITASDQSWLDCYQKLDTSVTGWRDVTFEAKVAADGCIYLAAAYFEDDGPWLSLYIKDVEIVPGHAVKFETNGGSAVEGTVISEGLSLANFDAYYKTSNGNKVFSGWYTSPTFEEGTRIGKDIATMPAEAITVYAKWGDEADYVAEFDSTAGWFSGIAAKVAEGFEPASTVSVTLELQTTLDGGTDTAAKIAAFKGAAAGNDTWQNNAADLDVTRTGWRTVTFEAVVAPDGCVYLGAAYFQDAGTPFRLYMRNVKVGEAIDYTAHFYTNSGSWFGGEAAHVAVDGAKKDETVVLKMQVRTSLDGTEGASITLYQEVTQWIDSTMGANYGSGVALAPATSSGWRTVTITVTLAEDGYVWLAAASEKPELGECYVYIKGVEKSADYTAKYYSNSGSWFGGEAAHVAVDGVKKGETVVLSMQLRTTQDGKAGAVIKLYQEVTQWIDPTMGANYAAGVYLSPATSDGWREIRLTVTLTEDGYVWLAAASEKPELGACDVGIKDVKVLDGTLYVANFNSPRGSWFGGEAARVAVPGAKAGETVTLTVQVMTTQDGVKGAVLNLYQTNSQWLGDNSSENTDKAVALTPATSDGWRTVTITVTLAEDGYVWLGAYSENPDLGECQVYIFIEAE